MNIGNIRCYIFLLGNSLIEGQMDHILVVNLDSDMY